MESDEVPNVLTEEATAGDGTHADVLRQPLAEAQVIPHAVFRHVEQHVIGTLRFGETEAELSQAVAEEVTHVGVVVVQLLVIAVREAESHRGGLHQGCGGTDGEEIVLGSSGEEDDDSLIARSTMDDRIFMHVTAVLHLPAAEGIVFEDNSNPDLDAEPVVTEGLDAILKVKAEKEETSNGFDFYATTVTLNENLEIVKIQQDFDVAQ